MFAATWPIPTSSVTSQTTPVALNPACDISETVASTSSWERSKITQRTRFALNSTATALPIPLPAPVITAVRPTRPSHSLMRKLFPFELPT